MPRGYKLKCCNCGGETVHSSAYRGCEVSMRQAKVQRVKVCTGNRYAEAAKKVPGNVTMVRQMVTLIHVKNEVKSF